jgi:secreted trypsin-like serine protease
MGNGSRRYFQRIMGGSVAEISDFPYAVSLRKNGEHYCGGSLVKNQEPGRGV